MICASRFEGRGLGGIDGSQVIGVIELGISERWMKLLVYRERH